MISKASIRLLRPRIIGLALPGAIAIEVLAKESLAKLEMPFQKEQATREFYRTTSQ
jgi:hypothetical protein